jgi:hypothetical protein
MKKYFYLSLIVLITSSCSYSVNYIQPGSKIYPQTNASEVKLYSNDLTTPYTVIGNIAVDVYSNGEKAERYLKQKAAEMGADAVIFVKMGKISSFHQRTGLSGVAIHLEE